MDNRTHALALLPEREADYNRRYDTLTLALATGTPRAVMAAQQSLGFALANLNTTRAAAGLSAIVGPRRHSLDELLSLPAATTALAAAA